MFTQISNGSEELGYYNLLASSHKMYKNILVNSVNRKRNDMGVYGEFISLSTTGFKKISRP